MNTMEEIYREYGDLVYYYLLSLCHQEHLAEELAQETMLRAILNIDSFRGEGKLSTWLCQIAKNLYFERCQKGKRTAALDEEILNGAVQNPSIEEGLEDRETANLIFQCLHGLREPYKEVFTLHALGDVPLKKISMLFGKSESWARVTYYRAKAMILSQMGEGEG